MNNESENRIDLTQFEGMTVGPWVSEEWDEGKILGPISEIHNNSHPVVAVIGDGWWGDMMVECNANKRAMAAVPDLIEELKRCYEREDKANEVMLSARELLMYHYDIFVQFTHTTDLQDEEILDTVKALSEASE